MFTLEISWDDIKLFLAIVVIGAGHSWYYFNKGKKRGFDDCAYLLSNEGMISIDDETLEIKRVSDKEYKRIKKEIEDF